MNLIEESYDMIQDFFTDFFRSYHKTNLVNKKIMSNTNKSKK